VARPDGRGVDELRPVRITRNFLKQITRNFLKHPEGSVLIETGDTRVICTASVEERVPSWLYGSGRGWVTAEYSMLPRATQSRNTRESRRGRVGGRTHEIQRLIGRSLRSVVRLDELGERTIWIDCDVIQADGGTRTASITGGFVALADAFTWLYDRGDIDTIPFTDFIAATSVGIVNGEGVLDLNYVEDSSAQVDMNCVLTSSGKLVEIQGTGEEAPFPVDRLEELLLLAQLGTEQLIDAQKEVLGTISNKIERFARDYHRRTGTAKGEPE